jgi:hypothetical protein
MCYNCEARQLATTLCSTAAYYQILTFRCPFCTREHGFTVGEKPLNPRFQSNLVAHVEEGVHVVYQQLSTMFFSFSLHRKALKPILTSSKKDWFNETEQGIITRFTTFVFTHIGKKQDKSEFAVKLKETTRSAQWLINAGVTSAHENLLKLQAHGSYYDGCKEMMIDCCMVTFSRMIDTLPPESNDGSDSDDSDLNQTYPFESRLMSISYARKMFDKASNEGPIDLTD